MIKYLMRMEYIQRD